MSNSNWYRKWYKIFFVNWIKAWIRTFLFIFVCMINYYLFHWQRLLFCLCSFSGWTEFYRALECTFSFVHLRREMSNWGMEKRWIYFEIQIAFFPRAENYITSFPIVNSSCVEVNCKKRKITNKQFYCEENKIERQKEKIPTNQIHINNKQGLTLTCYIIWNSNGNCSHSSFYVTQQPNSNFKQTILNNLLN